MSSFNEAGAVMPRKATQRPLAKPLWTRFNEAGAVMPRKGRREGRRRRNLAGASMRPGQ